jgi:transposase
MADKEDYFMFKELAREQEQTTGRVNISELSRETGFDRKTVRHYLSQDIPPETSRTRNKPSMPDPKRFFEEIQKQGYNGKSTTLGDYLRQFRPRIPALPDVPVIVLSIDPCIGCEER